MEQSNCGVMRDGLLYCTLIVRVVHIEDWKFGRLEMDVHGEGC